jgi:hypothetical protein
MASDQILNIGDQGKVSDVILPILNKITNELGSINQKLSSFNNSICDLQKCKAVVYVATMDEVIAPSHVWIIRSCPQATTSTWYAKQIYAAHAIY